MAQVQLALDRGQMLRAFDQAAWHATDALLEDARAQGRLDRLKAELGGWIVRIAPDNTLAVVFFDKDAVSPHETWVAHMTADGTRVVSSAFAAPGTVITDPLSLRTIRARKLAAQFLEGAEVLRCAQAPFNITILPPDTSGGDFPVYLMTPQTDRQHVPLGGHTRIMVAPDGPAHDAHAFSKSCLDMPTDKDPTAPTAFVATQILDPVPTEIAVFTMFEAGLPLYIITPDARTWVVDATAGQARISLLPNPSAGRKK